MGYRKQTYSTGKFRQHDPVNGWPTVIIYTFRETPEGVVQDTLQLKTDYPPALNEFVQGFDGEYTKVVKVEKSYQVESAPVIYVTCEYPKDTSLRC